VPVIIIIISSSSSSISISIHIALSTRIFKITAQKPKILQLFFVDIIQVPLSKQDLSFSQQCL